MRGIFSKILKCKRDILCPELYVIIENGTVSSAVCGSDSYNKSVFSLVNSAVNVTLPTFAAERRAAAPLLLSAGTRRCRSIRPVCGVRSSKPVARRSGCRMMGRTGGRSPDVDPYQHTIRAVSVNVYNVVVNEVVVVGQLATITLEFTTLKFVIMIWVRLAYSIK